MNQNFMKEQKILPLIATMSLPMVISMAVNALYNIVDSYFVAKISDDAMTALSLVFPIQNMVNAIAIGFGIGVNACIAFFLGAEKKDKADMSASWGVLLSLLHGIILTVVCIAIMPAFLRIFTREENILNLAISYSNRVFLFAAAVNVGICYEKIFQAVGKMKVSMFSMMAGCVANIILDPLMIFGIGPFPAMGIQGAAYATGIGQCLTLAVYLLLFWLRPSPVKVQPGYLKKEGTLIGRLYRIGVPATLNTALPSVQISVLNQILSGFSGQYVLVLGIYYKLQTFIYLSANGIVQGIRPLVGFNAGAGEKKRVQDIFRTSLFDCLGMSRTAFLPFCKGCRGYSDGRRSTSDNQHRFCDFLCFRDLLRRAGGTGKGNRIPLDFPDQIYCSDAAPCLFVQPDFRGGRRMVRLCGDRMAGSGFVLLYLEEDKACGRVKYRV